MRIALEEHFTLNEPAHFDRWLTLIPNVPEDIVTKIKPLLRDVGEGRIELMAKAGIDFAVLSNVGSMQGMLDPTPAMRLAREANDHLAEVVQKHPDYFGGFATVPLQDPEAGTDEFERAVGELGMKGALIIGHTNGAYLDDDRFKPFWERAEALDVPVYLHAADAAVMPATYVGKPELIGVTWSWTAETAAHALRLIFGGVFDRYPKARLMLGHMAETLPFLLWRLDARAKAFTEGASKKPSAVIRHNFEITTAGTFSDEPLDSALKALGEDKIMFSVDHPFESMTEASIRFFKAPISGEVQEKIESGNAKRLLRL